MSISTQLEDSKRKRTEVLARGEHLSLLTNRSLTVWILGFFTFATALTTFHALLLQTQYGPNATFETYLLSPFTGPIQVSTYFWASLILTCAVFGATSFAAFRFSFEFDALVKLNSVLNHNTKQLVALLSDKNKAIEEDLRQSLSQGLDIKIDNLRQDMEAEMGKQQRYMQNVAKRVETMEDTRRKLMTLERKLLNPKVTMNDKPRKIKGIGPRLTEKLELIGVTNVGELITADPMTIAGGTHLSEDKAKVLQARAKMLTIPGLDEKQIKLLEEMVITSK